MSAWHIAQINVARARFPLEHPRLAGFLSRLEDINALAERSSGFVWRLQTEAGDATAIKVNDDPRLVVNLSLWETIDALFDFAYRSGHKEVMAMRRHWFEKPTGAYQALWWVAAGTRPTAEEGLDRIGRLDRDGPGPGAFTFKERFAPPATLHAAAGS